MFTGFQVLKTHSFHFTILIQHEEINGSVQLITTQTALVLVERELAR